MFQNDMKKFYPGVFCFFTICAFCMDRSIPQSSDITVYSFLESLGSRFALIHLVLGYALYYFYEHSISLYKNAYQSLRDKLCVIIPAGLFASFMILGYSFRVDNSWQLVFKDFIQITKSFLAAFGYFFLFFCFLVQAFCWGEHIKTGELPIRKRGKDIFGRYIRLLETHPFLTAFFTFLAVYLPGMVISFPGIFMGDTWPQIAQAYQLPEYTSNYLNLISEDVRLNGHHPVAHTLVLHICIRIGLFLFSSWNAGTFLYICLQVLLTILTLSAVACLLIRMEINSYGVWVFILYEALSPRNQNYLFLITKDVLFADFLLLFILLLHRILTGTYGVRHMVLSSAAAAAIVLFRNDGKYLLVLSLAGVFLFCKKKLFLSLIAVTIGTSLIYGQILLPFFQITPGSIREMLSIPFQQTARYVRDVDDEVTDEEKEAISQVLCYEAIAEVYDPNMSDKVKSEFNESATSQELKAYFSAWFQMFWKHPEIYIQATMNNIFEYFYPDTVLAEIYDYDWSIQCMNNTNECCAVLGTDFHHPEKLERIRDLYECLRESIFKLPFLSVLLMPAAYVWTLISWFFFCIKEKNTRALALLLPLAVQLLVCITGPVNGSYFRYLYPVAFCLPAVILLGFRFEASSSL